MGGLECYGMTSCPSILLSVWSTTTHHDDQHDAVRDREITCARSLDDINGGRVPTMFAMSSTAHDIIV